jgi:hypothetical protein
MIDNQFSQLSLKKLFLTVNSGTKDFASGAQNVIVSKLFKVAAHIFESITQFFWHIFRRDTASFSFLTTFRSKSPLFYSWNFIINNIQKELFKDLHIDQMEDTCDQECQ